ncbi:hypothetical protein [Microbulbifer epialgicus]|uniref:Uncharacterized protein n=1 Tax=Microbulbifer epialgicus TaxID=393907 RepID=A0ABV4NUZ9_9GAMM
MNYQAKVQQNLLHLGTPSKDWEALPILGMEDVQIDGSKSKKMPRFSFPAGYKTAPSLYTGKCCNLCGTNIKNVYWIKNDKRRWTMPVGSECVSHFGSGDSGHNIVQKTIWERDSELLISLIELRRDLWGRYSKRKLIGPGRYESKIYPHTIQEKRAGDLHKKINNCLGRMTSESGKAATTRWANKYREQAELLMKESLSMMKGRETQIDI